MMSIKDKGNHPMVIFGLGSGISILILMGFFYSFSTRPPNGVEGAFIAFCVCIIGRILQYLFSKELEFEKITIELSRLKTELSISNALKVNLEAELDAFKNAGFGSVYEVRRAIEFARASAQATKPTPQKIVYKKGPADRRSKDRQTDSGTTVSAGTFSSPTESETKSALEFAQNKVLELQAEKLALQTERDNLIKSNQNANKLQSQLDQKARSLSRVELKFKQAILIGKELRREVKILKAKNEDATQRLSKIYHFLLDENGSFFGAFSFSTNVAQRAYKYLLRRQCALEAHCGINSVHYRVMIKGTDRFHNEMLIRFELLIREIESLFEEAQTSQSN